ncbi:MAG TPA: serine/threonine-protein kinase, partial [Kofleriaceae bacterium]
MKDLAAVGDVLAGKYRVDKILGIGGMGMVVAATHLEIDQRVAIKFMLPSSGESPETAARFLREAKAAGRLNSDHVCRVFDVGRFDSGAPYIVMEYLQGESVAALLRRHGPLRVSDAVDFILQAIEGLAEAHAHGIIHRDLKPDNLFLHKRNDGGTIVKLLDFGISKVSVAGLSTRTGDIMGSPAYMAPEQMESTRSVDARADVWSLGVVLYQLVVGHAPFRGDTLPLLCMHVVNDDPDPMSAIRGDLPDGFEAAVMKCLHKEPGDRYADVGELARALAPFGPRNATTSASRIQIVLQRTGKHDSAATIPHELGDRETGADSPQVNTLVGTAGQSLPRGRDGRSWGVLGAIVAGTAVGALVIAMLWRTGWMGDDALPGAPAVAKPSPAVAAPEP